MSGVVPLGCALAVASALIAGCSQVTSGLAVPAADVAVTSPQPRSLPPPTHIPRDVRAYGDRPCGVFSTDQLADFGFDRPPDSTDTLPSGNKMCVWIDSDRTGRLTVGTYPNRNVLEGTYAARISLPVFESIDIAGLPAAVYQTGIGVPRCDVTVGLAERQGLDVTFTDQREPYEDPCRRARAAAEVAVGNLPPLN